MQVGSGVGCVVLCCVVRLLCIWIVLTCLIGCLLISLRVKYKGQSLIDDLLFCCCESFVAQVDYCVCGVRLLSSLVSVFLASFMGNS